MVKKREVYNIDVEERESENYIGVKTSTDKAEEIEWFKKDGERPCVRGISIKESYLEKDTSAHHKIYQEAFAILKQLSKKEKDAREAREEHGMSGAQKRSRLAALLERKRHSSEKFVAGIPATKIGAEITFNS